MGGNMIRFENIMFCGEEIRPEKGTYLFAYGDYNESLLNVGDWVSVIVKENHFSARVSEVHAKYGNITAVILEEGVKGAAKKAFRGYRSTGTDIEMYRTYTEFKKGDEITDCEEIEI